MMHDTVASPPTLMKRTICLLLIVFVSLSSTESGSLFADATIISSVRTQSGYRRVAVRTNGWGLALNENLPPVSELNQLIVSLRGGSDTESESEEYDDDEESSGSDVESDDESDDEDEDSTEDEYDSDEEYDEEEEDEEDAAVSTKTETSNPEDQEYDEVLMPTSFQQLGVTLGVTFISNRLDMSDKRVIKFAR